MNRLLKYGYSFLLLFLGWSQLLAGTNAVSKESAETTEQLTVDYYYQPLAPKDFRLEVVYIEERLESDDDDDQYFLPEDEGSFYLSFLIGLQPHFLHHASNSVLADNPRLSVSSRVSAHIVNRVLRL